MRIAIVGFSGCGKSACFKAITQKSKEETDTLDPTKSHLGTVKITDPRLEKLKTVFNPKKVTRAEMIFEDLPGFHIPQIKEAEALMEVLGIFQDRDPVKDIEEMDTEFMLADLEIINKRLPGLEKEIRQEKSREKELERQAIIRCKDFLENGKPLRGLELADEEKKEIRGYQFLSRKPVFILGNIDEGRRPQEVPSSTAKNIDREGRPGEAVNKMKTFCGERNIKCLEFCAKLEAEIADLEESERDVFLKEMGLEKRAHEAVIELAYEALGYITFFTVKGPETRAWPVARGITAIEAAGRIHSDIEKGFIKAEVVSFNDLAASGSLAEARKKALLKLEGKEYKIQDGDIIDFRFSV